MCVTAVSGVDPDFLLQNAIKPAGSTLYVWGGGWNAADDGSGETTLHVGVWPEWRSFFDSHRKGYSYIPGQVSWKKGNRKWRFYGLDCSGYIGWCVYNSVQKDRSQSGYVVSAAAMAASLADHGYGSVKRCTPSDMFRPGDIVSLQDHCFLCLGQCDDGSVLILHSTPNGGVQMSGTVSDADRQAGTMIPEDRFQVSGIVSGGMHTTEMLSGKCRSKASQMAAYFMRTNYPVWWESFGCEGRQAVDASVYLNGTRFRWRTGIG